MTAAVPTVAAASCDSLAPPSTSSSLPPNRCPARFAGVAASCRLTDVSSEARPADAVEAAGAVEAAAPVQARLTGAVVQVDGAEAPAESHRANAQEAVEPINTGGAIGTWLHQTVINVSLTVRPREAGQAATRQLWCETVSVLTETAIFTRRPAGREEEDKKTSRLQQTSMPGS